MRDEAAGGRALGARRGSQMSAVGSPARDCNASLAIAKASGCPSGLWQDQIAPLLAAGRVGDNLTLVNVGANKGFNVAEFLQRYNNQRGLTSVGWHQELLRAGKAVNVRVRYGCGLCNACRAPRPRTRLHVPVDVHAIEMVRLNAMAIRKLFAVFGVPGRVHHLAMSNYSGVAKYRAASAVGLEHFELGKDVDRYRAEAVPCMTLDAFAATHLGAGRRIDLLSVDVEGQDALVLEGAEQLLAARAVGVVEFEYIGRGYWRADKGAERRLLQTVLARLEGFGYRCYWQGDHGRLARASGAYWCDAFAFRLRSNLVCTHRADVRRVFERLAVA